MHCLLDVELKHVLGELAPSLGAVNTLFLADHERCENLCILRRHGFESREVNIQTVSLLRWNLRGSIEFPAMVLSQALLAFQRVEFFLLLHFLVEIGLDRRVPEVGLDPGHSMLLGFVHLLLSPLVQRLEPWEIDVVLQILDIESIFIS